MSYLALVARTAHARLLAVVAPPSRYRRFSAPVAPREARRRLVSAARRPGGSARLRGMQSAAAARRTTMRVQADRCDPRLVRATALRPPVLSVTAGTWRPRRARAAPVARYRSSSRGRPAPEGSRVCTWSAPAARCAATAAAIESASPWATSAPTRSVGHRGDLLLGVAEPGDGRGVPRPAERGRGRLPGLRPRRLRVVGVDDRGQRRRPAVCPGRAPHGPSP